VIRIEYISDHAFQKGRAYGFNREQCEAKIRSILLNGTRTETPNGPAYRVGALMVGVRPMVDGVRYVVTTFYRLLPKHVRELGVPSSGLLPKPGRSRASRRRRLQRGRSAG
jgi:hypothetical protein